MTDEEWAGAERLSLDHQVLPGDNVTPTERTTVLVSYDADHLYLAIRAFDSEPAGIRGRVVPRDDLSSEDPITIHLDTFNDRRRAYVFIVNPLGIRETACTRKARLVAIPISRVAGISRAEPLTG